MKLRSLILAALATCILTGCATGPVGAIRAQRDPGGVPVADSDLALDALERCSNIERTNCRVDGSGFRGSTSPGTRTTQGQQVPQQTAPMVPMQPMGPQQLPGLGRPPVVERRPLVVMPNYGPEAQYFGYGPQPSVGLVMQFGGGGYYGRRSGRYGTRYRRCYRC